MRLLGLGLVLVVAIGAAAVGLYVHDRGLPVYEVGEQPPVDDIAVNTLKLGGQTYVSGPFEFSLEVADGPLDLTWGRKLGTTSRDESVYRPKGDDGSRFVFTRGFMSPDIVYRNAASNAPASLAELKVSAADLLRNKGGSLTTKYTTDRAITQQLVATLSNGPSVPAGDLASVDLYRVRLLSDQLPGLAYFAYVIVDGPGTVYLARRAQESVQWLPVNGSLAQWLYAWS